MLKITSNGGHETEMMEGTHVPSWAERQSLRPFHAQTDIPRD